MTKSNLSRCSHLMAALALLGAGCTTQRLRVVTKPAGAQVTIRNATGKDILTGAAPVELPVDFSRSNPNYLVEITPTGSLVNRYAGNATNLTKDAFLNLPAFNGDKNHRLDLTLEDKLITNVIDIEVVLDPLQRWRGAVILARAYKDISEVGGTVPTQIADFEDSKGFNRGVQSLALSPDGNRIVYSIATYRLSADELSRIAAAAEPSPIDVGGANLFAIRINAGGVEQLTSEDFRDMFPAFTADGQNLLFTSNRRRAGSEDLLSTGAMNRSGVSDIHLEREGRVMKPTQAKDETIAYCLEVTQPLDPKQRFTIWTIGGANRYPTQIQTGHEPSISPDGKKIAYIGYDGNLWVVNSDGSQATQLTFGADKIPERYQASLDPEELARYRAYVRDVGAAPIKPFSYPSWSADGKRILYTAMEGSDSTGRPNEDIWIMDFDGSNKKQLTTNGSIDRYPLLSPDGKWVYFMSNRGGHWAIWRIAAPAS